jgi:hypothetical protein
MTYGDIAFILALKHHLVVSERNIKRILRAEGMGRRKFSPLADVVSFIQSELSGSGVMHGYRMMYGKCKENGLAVRKEDVRLILQELDPRGVDDRRCRRLTRRRYAAEGPNAVWHLDGYDKLKPYGLCISGCIDGFSRKMIWLNVYHTNNDPRVIGGYFLEAVTVYDGCPLSVRGDFGTENTYVKEFQRLLRINTNSCRPPYIDGASTLNQRIESWWGYLRRQCVQYWIEFFQQLQSQGNFNGDFLDKSLVQFCFMPTIQV